MVGTVYVEKQVYNLNFVLTAERKSLKKILCGSVLIAEKKISAANFVRIVEQKNSIRCKGVGK